MTVTIGRRELLAALGGAAAAWPLAGVRSRRECRSLDFSAAQRPPATWTAYARSAKD